MINHIQTALTDRPKIRTQMPSEAMHLSKQCKQVKDKGINEASIQIKIKNRL